MKSKNYFLDIANIYSRIIKESPDNITIIDDNGDRKYFSYDSTPDTYTGLIGRDGEYVLSKDIVGHHNLIDYILNSGEDVSEKLITNTQSIQDLKRLCRERIKIRIWKNQKVFSMWDKYEPAYEDAIKDSLKEIGENYQDYLYDNEYKEYSDLPDADNFFVKSLSDAEKEEKMRSELNKRESERALADAMAGVKRRPSFNDDNSVPYKKPSWMTRGGD